MKKDTHYLHLLIVAIVAAIVTACASMGRPEGGPRDVDPPLFVRSNPSPGETNVKTSKLQIHFDENVQIRDIMTKVVISPAQQINPAITANGRTVTVELKDTLKPNTTYSIDFSDAISDLNEGNEIDGFAFAFSTGETIDSLQISGMVLEAETLEPAQGMLVGVYMNYTDTSLTKLPLDRITRTNQYGQFTIRNLAEGEYRIFAINDLNRDYRWDRSEDIAFYDVPIVPTASSSTHTDTLKAADGTDSIVTHPATVYGPNDILLTWFNEKYQSRYMSQNQRLDQQRVYIEFSTPADSLPRIKILNGQFAGEPFERYSVINTSAGYDSIEYWIADTNLILQDSLILETTYLRTDTLDQLSWTTDTISFNVRGSSKKKEEPKNKKKSGEEADSIQPQIEFTVFKVDNGKVQDIHRPLFFSSAKPIKNIDRNGIHLAILEDSTWIDLVPPDIGQIDSGRPMKFVAPYDWESGAKYRLTVDSAVVTDIYGLWNNTLVHEFSVKPEEDYSSITFNITGLTEPAVVQLLNNADKPLAVQKVEGGKAVFRHLTANTYYARLFIDRNENGVYDGGSVADSIQPEDVYYYSKKIPLKEKWDFVQSWDINELPVDMQKPNDIKKNKPKPKPGEMPEEEEEEEDEFDNFYGPTNNFNNNNNNRNQNLRGNNGRFRENNPR